MLKKLIPPAALSALGLLLPNLAFAQEPTAKSPVRVTIKDDNLTAATVLSNAGVLIFQDNFSTGPSTTLGPNWTIGTGGFAINNSSQATPTPSTVQSKDTPGSG